MTDNEFADMCNEGLVDWMNENIHIYTELADEDGSYNDDAQEQMERDYIAEMTVERAADPATPVETLIELSQSESEDVRCNVQYNPTTPTNIRMWLAHGGYADMSLDEFLAALDGRPVPEQTISNKWFVRL
jgi:hypothetical protein